MNHIERAMATAAAVQREADAASVGRISAADREAGDQVGQLLTEFVWNDLPGGPGFESGAEIALSVARQVRATGSGFGAALAEWLERWAGESDADAPAVGPPPAAPAGHCRAMTQRGNPCPFHAAPGWNYCGTHMAPPWVIGGKERAREEQG